MIKRYHRPDYLLGLSVFVLLGIGLLTVFSASIVESYSVSGSNTYYFWRQVVAAVIGVVGWFIVQRIDYHHWRKWATIAFWCSVGLLLVVLIPGVGLANATAHSWINLGFTSFQPSELVKLTGIVYFASWFDDRVREAGSFYKTTLPLLGHLAGLAILLMLEPDLGGLVIIALIIVSQYWVAGGAVRHISLIGGLAGLGFGALVYAAPYRMQRFLVFLNPSHDPLGMGYQINQALMAVGSGGILGLGWGHSRQKYNYLPQASSDSVFAIMAEEMGLVQIVAIIGLYWLILMRSFQVVKTAPDNFGKVLATGIVSWFGFQTIINIGGILSLFPMTGVTLPLVSQGGSSLVMMMIALGILFNISKQTTDEAKALNVSGWWNGWSHYANIGRSFRSQEKRS